MYLVYFHNVLADACDVFDRETPRLTVSEFERQIDWISQRFPIIGFEESLERIDVGEVDEQVVALCFDDGHLGIHRHAFPCLEARGLNAGVFVVHSFTKSDSTDPLLHFESLEIAFRLTDITRLDRLNVEMPTEQDRAYVFQGARQRLKSFPDDLRRQRQAQLIEDLAVDPEAIAAYAQGDERFAKIGPAAQRELSAAGWVIGGHTRSHRVLSRLSDSEIDHEVAMPARLSEQRSGFRPFAYPYGAADHCDQRVAERTQAAGYDCAFTTIPGPLVTATLNSRYLLPRLSFRELMQLDA